jgi:hypothetical protein
VRIKAHRIARRARAPYYSWAIMREIRQTIRRDVIPDVKARFEDIVANWKHKPKFQVKMKVARDEIRVEGKAAGKDAKIWQYVSRGTKPHPITARRGKTLAFMWGGPGSYQPKTYPGPSWGGPGTVRGGKMAYPVSVEHPGSEGRKFEEWIAKVEGPRFQGRISAAIRRGKNKARRQSGY